MAIFDSTQYANQVAIPPVLDSANKSYGKLRFQEITFTKVGAGADGDDIRLIKLPPGRVTLLGGKLSFLRFSAFGASRVWKLGYLAYKNKLGVDVAQSLSAIQSAVDISAAVETHLLLAAQAAFGSITFESLSGVTLIGEVTGGTIPDGATIGGGLVYSVE